MNLFCSRLEKVCGSSLKLASLLALTGLILSAPRAKAVVIEEFSSTGPLSPWTVYSDDLLQTSVSNITQFGNFTQDNSGGVAVLTNGALSIGGAPDNLELATGINNGFVIYDLDLSVNTLGYDISSIITYGGWGDGGRDAQRFSIYYSLVGNAAYTLLETIDHNPSPTPSVPSAVKAEFTANLSGVDGIFFSFYNGQENGYAGYGEFDVVGTATAVPEPSTYALLGLGLGVMVFMRIKRRNSGA